MQREILFKAKRKYTGEWVFGYLVKENNRFYIAENIDEFYQVISETVCQYTGLKDKNGMKIFENDIIRLDDDHRKMISSANAKREEDLVRKDCLVGFKYGSFMFARNKYKINDFDSYLWLSNKHCEVIGNIFDEEVK